MRFVFLVALILSACGTMDYSDDRLKIVNKSGKSLFIYWDFECDLYKIYKRDSVHIVNLSSYKFLEEISSDSATIITLQSSKVYTWEDFFKEHKYVYIFTFDSAQYKGDFEENCLKNKYYKVFPLDYKKITNNNWKMEIR